MKLTFAMTFLLLLDVATAQTRSPFSGVASGNDSAGYLCGVRVLPDGKLRDTSLNRNLVQTGVTFPGDFYFFFSVTDDVEFENLLICGRNQNGQNGVGVVEHWKRNTNSEDPFVLQGQPALVSPGTYDFTGVAYAKSMGKIFLLDFFSKSIYENEWDGVSQVPSSGWSLSITPAQVPELMSGFRLDTNGRLTPPRLILSKNRDTVLMHWDPQLGLQVERAGMNHMREVGIVRLSLSEGNTALSVRGVYGSVVQIVDVSDSSVIGATVIPYDNDVAHVNLSRALVIGNRYLARKAGEAPSPDLFSVPCPVRYGYSESLSSGVSLSGKAYPIGFNVGFSKAMSYLATYKVDPEAPKQVSGYMALAFRDQQGQDPVVQVGDNWLLNTNFFIEVTGYVSQPNGHIAGYFSIPDDPNLIGAVLLTQFWIQDGETYRLSQIIGAKIEGEGALKAPSGGDKKTGLSLDQFKLKTGANKIIEEILKQRAKAK